MAGGAPELRLKLFMDGVDLTAMRAAYLERSVAGFTTNPSLMRRGGVTDYEAFCRTAIRDIPDLPLSFEVFSDDFAAMEREARAIATWGGYTYVKIPITNTRGESSLPLIQRLSHDGLRVNVTAILTLDQVRATAAVLDAETPSIVSVFAGRIADTGIDPVPLMKEAVRILAPNPRAELLWASPRELLNLFQASDCGCHILTATPDILKKLSNVGRDLDAYSLETVKMFYDDACAAGYKIL
jgi:transaldolase